MHLLLWVYRWIYSARKTPGSPPGMLRAFEGAGVGSFLSEQTTPGSSSLRVGIIDASNVARSGLRNGRITRLKAMLSEFQEHHVLGCCIADASLRYVIDDPDSYQNLLDEEKVVQAPAGSTADEFIVGLAAKLSEEGLEPFVVTNDKDLGTRRFAGRNLKFMFARLGEREFLVLGRSLDGLNWGNSNV
jgi:hypothetical protein